MKRISTILLVISVGLLYIWNENYIYGIYKTNSAVGRLSILSPLSEWSNTLGAPVIVKRSSGRSTYYYWPKIGVGVITHPHYEAQLRKIDSPSLWKVTSIIIPVNKHLHSSFQYQNNNIPIPFKQLLDISCKSDKYINCLMEQYYFKEIAGDKIYLFNTFYKFLSNPLIICHMENNKLQEIEIRENSLLAWYD